jgi:hypothetical protein
MAVEMLIGYDRERLALYVAGLLPDSREEAQAVLELAGRLLPILSESRAEHPHDQDYGRHDDQDDEDT